jgi:MFS family permease
MHSRPAGQAQEVMAKPEPTIRYSMRMVMTAWLFGAVWLYIVTGAALTKYAKVLHMPDFGFGVLAALPFAGALVQLPMSYFIERYGFRKRFFVILGVIHRGMWMIVALIPWILPPAFGWGALLALVGLSWTFGQMPAPIWVSWMADLVPAQIRGRYFSLRSRMGQIVGMIITLAIGFVLDRAELFGPATLLKTLSGAMAVAGFVGTFDYLCFLPVAEMRSLKPNPAASIVHLIRTPLLDKNFRRFLGFTATLTFAIGFMAQFSWLYLFDVAGMSNTQANLMLVFIPLLISIIFFPIWGRLLDRLGRKPVLVIAGLLIVPGSASWIFVTREHWVAGYLGVVSVTAAWPGVELAIFNMLLSIADRQGEQGLSSGYVSVNSALGAVAGVCSGLFAGIVAKELGDWRGIVFGITLTYHGLLFLVSGVLRLVALGWLIRMEDSKAYSTREAFRYMGTNLYSNLQQTIYIPGRLLMQLGRWTYQVNRRKK